MIIAVSLVSEIDALVSECDALVSECDDLLVVLEDIDSQPQLPPRYLGA
jgi:hypothetical protein